MEDYYNINLEQYDIGRTYNRNGLKCLFDPIREKFIVLTQEEIIRQKFIRFMIDKMNVPENKIDIEVPLSRFKAGAKGRADIVIFGQLSQGDDVPVLIVECKAPNVPLFDEVWYQVDKYDEILGAGYVIVTNGTETLAGKYNKDTFFYDILKRIPTYEELLEGATVIEDEVFESWRRPKFSELLSDQNIKQFKEYGFIGEDTYESLYPLIMNLAGFLNDTHLNILPNTLEDFKIIGEGLRYTNFGNAGGGGYGGDYKYLIIEGKNNNDILISFGIFGTAKTVDDPFWGTRTGNTALIVGSNYDGNDHSSLQLNIDKYTIIHDDYFELWHDGTLTIGGIGSAKRSEVINFIKEHHPSLVNSKNNIVLGLLKRNKEIKWEQEETKSFFANLIRYALLRDEFRAIKLKDHKLKNKKHNKRKK